MSSMIQTVDCEAAVEPAAPESLALFSAALRRFTEPFAFWSNASFAHFSPDGVSLAVVGDDCQCGKYPDANHGQFGAKKHYLREVVAGGLTFGRIVLCCSRVTPHAERTLDMLVELATSELARSQDEAALFSELSASWESLQAVYDLSADFSSFQDPRSLLIKITERTTAIHTEINTALWLEYDSELKPAAANCSFFLRPRQKESGLLGECFIQRHSLVQNDVSKVIISPDIEPELVSAKCLAILPLTTRLATYGVMAAWVTVKGFRFDSRNMRLLETLALQAAMVVENDRLNRESIQNEKLKQEVDIGSKIQQTLLSGTPPANPRGIEIGAASISSQKIDGDFYEFIEHSDQCFDLIIGDVMGKGIPAALVGAATKSSFLRAVARLQAIENKLRPSAEKIVTWVNRDVTPKLTKLDSFVTACYTRFDLQKREVTFVDCGHTKTIHYHSRDGAISLLEGENLPIGFVESEVFVEQTVTVADGDLLFFYSDGVTETMNPQGELFGDERLAQFIRLIAQLPPQQIIASLVENLFRFTTEKKFHDDFTCVAIRFGQTDLTKEANKRKIVLESSVNELRRLRSFVRNACVELAGENLGEEDIHDLELAATEALTNVVRHACDGRDDRQIEVVAEHILNGIQIFLRHDGKAFDQTRATAPNFDGSCDGGFGLFIIENCVDFVGYSTDKTNRNSIHLIKYFKN